MNKYIVCIPYKFFQFGDLIVTVYAENEQEAISLAVEPENRYSEDYQDNIEDSSTEYNWMQMSAELDQEDVTPQHSHTINKSSSIIKIPDYFLSEINLI